MLYLCKTHSIMKLLQYNLIIRLLCKNFCTYRSQLFIKEKENRGPWIPLFLLENKLNSNTIVTPTDLHFSIFAFKGRAKGARWVEILVDLKKKKKKQKICLHHQNLKFYVLLNKPIS